VSQSFLPDGPRSQQSVRLFVNTATTSRGGLHGSRGSIGRAGSPGLPDSSELDHEFARKSLKEV